jgi:hypothetical protein
MNIIQKRHIIAWSTTGTQNEALVTTPTLFFFYVLICDINLYYNRNVCRKRDLYMVTHLSTIGFKLLNRYDKTRNMIEIVKILIFTRTSLES